MAQFSVTVSVVTSTEGGSAGGAGMYQARRITQTRTETRTITYGTPDVAEPVEVREYDLSNSKDKKDVVYHAVMTPDGAPEWAKDYKTLWSEVHEYEQEHSTRPESAQEARRLIIALPRELSPEQNKNLTNEYVARNFVGRGMAAQIDIHDKGDGNPHAHVLCTMRSISADGFARKKDRSWNSRVMIGEWRESWAEHANRYLEQNGFDVRIDHRSYKDQGIDLVAMEHLGPYVNLPARAGRIEENGLIARENGEKILSDPNIALKAITHQQTTFTQSDVERFLSHHSAPEQRQKVHERVMSDPRVYHLGKDETGRDRYTTTEMIAVESAMMRHVKELDIRAGHQINRAIQTGILSEQQIAAMEHITKAGDIKAIVGVAGAGKSTMLNQVRQVWEQEGYRVVGAALSGIAAENLQTASGIESRTIASLIYQWDHGEHLAVRDILVVDEAGMIDVRQMERILKEVCETGAKVVLVGDPRQIQAIEAGAPFRAVLEQIGYAELTEVRRQKNQWQKDATKDFSRGKVSQALDEYGKHHRVKELETRGRAKQTAVEKWNVDRLKEPDKSGLILAHTRKDVHELNEMAREKRKQNGELGKGREFITVNGTREFAEHDRVIFLKNNRELDVKNGTKGTIIKIEGTTITVKLDRDDRGVPAHVATVDTTVYNEIDHGYAATVHKSQGSTVDRAYVLASPGMDSHLAYVGMSRHREDMHLYYGRDDFADRWELHHTLSREPVKYNIRDIAEPKDDTEIIRALKKELIPARPITEQDIKKLEAEILKLKTEIGKGIENERSGVFGIESESPGTGERAARNTETQRAINQEIERGKREGQDRVQERPAVGSLSDVERQLQQVREEVRSKIEPARKPGEHDRDLSEQLNVVKQHGREGHSR